MRYGLTLPITGVDGDVRRLVDYARLAEDAGWDGVFLEDYILFWQGDQSPLYDPWLALAAIATSTERIRLGVTVTPLSRRRPWKVAREALTLDHLSRGRLILGFGVGDPHDASFARFGEETNPRRRAELLDEGLDVLAGLLSGQPFAYQGTHYTVAETRFVPAPVQSPRIPIWIGGFWPRRLPALRAARWDGFCGAKVSETGDFAMLTVQDARDISAFMARERTSTAPFDIASTGELPDDPGAAAALLHEYADAGITWWMTYAGTGVDAEQARAIIAHGPVRGAS